MPFKAEIDSKSFADSTISLSQSALTSTPATGTRKAKLELENYDIDLIDPTTRSLEEDLQNAHAAIFFNSSASVAAVCAGIPIFVDDASCVAWKVANTDINNIETPAVYQREQWLYDLAAAHWTDADAKSGRIYQKFLPYLT